MSDASSIDFSAMPNPLAPEAWLAPEEANKHRIFIYILVSGLCVVLWDMLSCFPEDFTITFRRKWSVYTFLFLLSRVFTLAFLLEGTVSYTREVSNCHTSTVVSSAFSLVALVSINILLYRKVCQVYENRWWIVSLFGLGTLGTLAGPILDFWAYSGRHIEPTRYCELIVVRPDFVVTPVIEAGFVLITCLTILLQISGNTTGNESNLSLEWRSLSDLRTTAHKVSDRFLKDEKLYLLIAVCVKIPSIVAFGVFRGVDTVIQVNFAILDLSVVSIMVAKIYRKPLLGKPMVSNNNPPRTTIDFIKGSAGTASLSTQEAKSRLDAQHDDGDNSADPDIKSHASIV